MPSPVRTPRKGYAWKWIAAASALVLVLVVAGGSALGYILLRQRPHQIANATTAEARAQLPATPVSTRPAPATATPAPATRSEVVAVHVEPLAYVPADSNFIMGVHAGALLAHPATSELLEPLLKNPNLPLLAQLEARTGLAFKGLVHEVFVAGRQPFDAGPGAQPEAMTFIIKSRVPFDVAKMAAVLGSGPAVKVRGKDTYPSASPAFATLLLPSDRLIVLTTLTGPRLEALAATDGKHIVLPNLALVNQVRGHHAWLAVLIDAAARRPLQTELGLVAKDAPPDPQVQKALAILQEARGIVLWGRLDGNQLELGSSVACANPAVAKELSTALQGAWDKLLKPMTEGAEVRAAIDALPPHLKTLANELTRQLKFGHSGAVTQASIRLSTAPLVALAKDVQAQGPQAVLGALAPPPMPPPAAAALSAEEQQLLELVNRDRAAQKLPALKPNAKLTLIARAHAANMAKNGKLEHVLDGKNFDKRADEAGYEFEMINQLIVRGPAFNGKQAFELWNKNDGTRAVYLDKFTETGIGAARDEKGVVYFTQVVATPQPK